MCTVFIHFFSKHWVLFQPGLPLGLGVAGCSRILEGTVLGGAELIIWGHQPICCKDAATAGPSSLDMPRGTLGSSPEGVQEHAPSAQT